MYQCSYYKKIPIDDLLEKVYKRLYQEFGPQGWWPADSKFETIIGAILTQSVSWTNVEKAIQNLKEYSASFGVNSSGINLLSPVLIKDIDVKLLAELIRPSGYFNMKAKKLKAFINFLHQEYHDDLDYMFKEDLEVLRSNLLKVYGIGPETADSILLYAGNYPIFVIDAYTKRIFSRMILTIKDVDYHELQQLIMENCLPGVDKYNEYHALIVALGKNVCKKRSPNCNICPLVNNV